MSASTNATAPALDAFLGNVDRIVQTLRELCDVAANGGDQEPPRDRSRRELVQKLEEDPFHLVVVGSSTTERPRS